jgi:hypothetical protein
MEKVKQRRFRAGGWRKILGRFEESGLTAQAFCANERISARSLRRWQLRLGAGLEEALPVKTARPTSKPDGFIDLGALRSDGPKFEVRLELGAGVVLSIARG